MLAKKEVVPPFKPKVRDCKDTRNFDKVFTDERAAETISTSSMSSGQIIRNPYYGFTYEP